MILAGVAWRGFALPFRTPYITFDTRATSKYGLLLFLQNSDGLVGVGEASPVGVGSRAEIGKMAAEMETLEPGLLGTDFSDVDSGVASLGASTPLTFGLETALLDIKGKMEGLPLARLLGGVPHPVPINALIASDIPQEAASEAKKAVSLGFTCLKLKVAQRTPEQDISLVSAVRMVVGRGVKLRIDPNQGWRVAQAIQSIRRLSKYDLEFVEQPVSADDLAGLREVRRAVRVPIAADEALGSVDDLGKIVAADAADLFIIKAARLGGFFRALEVMRGARDAAKGFLVTSSLESSVGIAANAHLASMSPSQPFAHGLSTGMLFEEDLASPSILIGDGNLSPPKGHGLGVRIDMGQLKKHSIGISGSVGSCPELP